jgi:hypothetical protein
MAFRLPGFSLNSLMLEKVEQDLFQNKPGAPPAFAHFTSSGFRPSFTMSRSNLAVGSGIGALLA